MISSHSRFPIPRMMQIGMIILLILTCLGATVSAATTSTASSSTDTQTSPAWMQVTVTNVTADPGVFYTGDTGTITVDVANTGTESVNVHRATMYDNNIQLVSTANYDSVGSIGAGNSMRFTFTVQADVPEGIYYPVFSMEFGPTGYLRYPVTVQVKNSPVVLAIQDKPDTFVSGKKSTVSLSVNNMRTNTIKNIIVTPAGTDADIIPTSAVIGSLGPGMSEVIQFSITPQTPATLEFNASFLNGINTHYADISIPLSFNPDKTRADPVVNNIVVTPQGNSYKVTGDITNSGLESANSVTLTTDTPAVAVDPYKEYAVGLLKADDFSSFELTFTASGTTQVPLVIHWKDGNGNVYTDTTQIDLRSTGSVSSGTQGSSASSRGAGGGLFGPGQRSTFTFPWIWVIGGAVVAIAGFVIWRKYRKPRVP
jgi:hypothetical protein